MLTNKNRIAFSFKMTKPLAIFVFLSLFFEGLTQTSGDLTGAVQLDSLIKSVREFSGEDSCFVQGKKVKILNRESSSGNDLAADYLVERLNAVGITVADDVYSVNGRNIYGTQVGSVYPDSVVIFGGHYDAVADYCADDNASAVGIMLETARILAKYQFKKTIIYAFWDEEEIGLLGSKHHALQIYNGDDKVAGVLNIDMAAYDANDDGIFDIDLNSNSGSIKMKDELIAIRSATSLNISPMVVQPGTLNSDHASFWDYDYPAVLFGESWETSDQNSKYHTSEDRISLFNLPYYHEMAKLATAFMGQMAEPVTVGVHHVESKKAKAFLNPSTNYLIVNTEADANIEIFTLKGVRLFQKSIFTGKSEINLNVLSSGTYIVRIYSKSKQINLSKKITCSSL